MKYMYAALALAAAVRAQSRDDIPKCAIPCLDDAIESETSCEVDDYACVCKDFDSIQGAATGCVLEECGSDVALNDVLPAVEALCDNIGDGETTTGGSEPTTTAEPTEEPTEEPTGEPTEAPTEAPTEEPTPTPAPTKTPGSTTLAPTQAPTNGTGPAPTSEPGPVPTTGAAAAFGPAGGVALAGLAFLAL